MTTQPLRKIAKLAVLSLFLLAIFACDSSTDSSTTSQAQTTGEVHNLVFEAHMTGYVGVGGEFDGVQNPIIEVNQGDEVNIRVINKEAWPTISSSTDITSPARCC